MNLITIGSTGSPVDPAPGEPFRWAWEIDGIF